MVKCQDDILLFSDYGQELGAEMSARGSFLLSRFLHQQLSPFFYNLFYVAPQPHLAPLSMRNGPPGGDYGTGGNFVFALDCHRAPQVEI